jgi:ribosomal protein S18 acetylase RimI-like enzyme
MNISQAKIADAEEILYLQKLSYQSEAELYNDYNIPPLTQTLEELKTQFKDHVILKAVIKDKIIGTVRAHEENGISHVGRLAVHPKMQNQGIGTALLVEIEKYYKCKRFELFTGSKSNNNIRLYQKLAYSVFKTSKIGCGDIEIFYMGKSI